VTQPRLWSVSLQAEPFQEVVNTLVGLGAERVLVLEGPKPFRVRAAYGISDGQPWDQQVSLSLLEQTIGEGAPLLLGDAQTSTLGERWSLMLNQVRSVLCVPFWTPSSRIAGVLYADTRSKAGVFSRMAMDAVQQCARKLEATLYSAPPLRSNQEPVTVGQRGVLGLRRSAPPPAPAAVRAAPRAAAAPGGRRPSASSVTVFYRSLATMVEAGVPLSRALDVLSSFEADLALQSILRALTDQVQAGSTVSAAMTQHPAAFAPIYVHMVRVGEQSGRLHAVLPRLAAHREKAQASGLRLKQALTYPVLVLLLCLLMVTLGPLYLLQGQVELLRSSGQTLPLLTRAFVAFSDLLRNPWAWLAGGGALLAAAPVFSRCTTPLQRYALLSRVPGLRPLLDALLVSRFASTLSLAYRVGIPIGEALQLAGTATQNPVMAQRLPALQERLRDGATLAGSLEAAELFPAMFLQLVRAGEETGKVDDLVAWVAEFYELELETSIERFLTLIEPLLLLGMGILVAVVLLATMLPMVRLLETL
jgi:type II secretory pathway component PulF